MNKTIAGLLAGWMLVFSQPLFADTFAIVIGIDAYEYVNPLDGAVNDARIMAEVLEQSGAKRVTLLLNERASREEIQKAWFDISSIAKAGDTIYFTYAGHGAQYPERLRGTEEDGMDEFYVLAKFGDDGITDTKDTLFDNDLWEWFAGRPDLTIVLVSDSCHSGTMTRAYNKSKFKVRRVRVDTIQNDSLPLPKSRDLVDERIAKLNHVISFSGVPDDQEVPEVKIGDETHGALSWYFANGLKGFADINNDATVTLSELKDFLIEKVRMQTAGQQHPQISFADDLQIIKIGNGANAPIPNSLPELLANELPPISFSIHENSSISSSQSEVLSKLSGINVVAEGPSLLEWDLDDAVIRNELSDVVYYFPKNTTKAYKRVTQKSPAITRETIDKVQSIINKFRLTKGLESLSDASMSVKLVPGDQLYKKGETVTFEVSRLKYPYFTLVNLSVDGTINFLYPSETEDRLEIPTDQPYQLTLEVAEPFGADHFVAIASDQPLTSLHARLKNIAFSASPLDDFRKEMASQLKGRNYQIGIHATFTTDSL